MFKGLGNLGNIASLMNQARTMGPKMKEAMEQLKHKQVTGIAGGGMVTVHANGEGNITGIEIDPVLQENKDIEMMLDLLPAAINQAVMKARELHAEAMQSVTSDLPIPENMENMLKSFLGGDDSDNTMESPEKVD